MRRFISGLALTALLAAGLFLAGQSTHASASPGTYKLDPVHTAVVFKVKHLGVSYTYGRFNDISGSFTIDPDDPAKSQVEVTIKADSIDTNDKKRDQHLRSPDFFNVKQFPVITFKSTGVAKDGDTYKVTGELFLHGVTKSVTIPFEHVGSGKDPWGGFRSGFDGTITISRSAFGMDYMPDGVGDKVTLMIGVEGIRQ